MKWHSIALSEYWRTKQIPRGLRMNKRPSLGNKDPMFLQKWEQVLNKCSLDLTLLIVEQTKQEATQVHIEIENTRELLQKELEIGEWTGLENSIKEELIKFEKELKAYKIKKFERDAEDYKNDAVYNWKDTAHDRPESRRANWRRDGWRQNERQPDQLRSQDERSDPGHTSESSMDDHFLGGHRRPPPHPPNRGGRKRRGGARDRSNRSLQRITRSMMNQW